ncbi:glycogen/starch/alpha-glucan phosphorylase [Anaerorhabdus sp.]|uniref:glycogen/starch/alpha-glucan phosphorylase n=1 Tax=Anaerorhabdus sp. TaxID=1872524 RepID=UPI002FCB10A8
MNIENKLQNILKHPIKDSTKEELFLSLMTLVKEETDKQPDIKGDKKLYYISAEFLIGKLLSNNLINLHIYDEVKQVLENNGFSLNEIEEFENEPSLGNGGLGRLAACFLDSIATLQLDGDGIGLNYHYGLFKQVFENHKQQENINPWIQTENWLIDTHNTYIVPFGGFKCVGHLFDINILGYNGGKNKLHLFDIETLDETIVKDGITFDKSEIEKNLTLFLYPDDSDEKGHLLRIYQQYFMVSCGAQYILDECKKNNINLHELSNHIVIQINDTHPTLVIPELIRLLIKEGLTMDEAISIVSNTCAYTNHTILQEALEKWPITYLEKVVPHLITIIEELNNRVNKTYNNPTVSIIDDQNRVHMARIDMHYGFSINGVAAIHTDILKHVELKEFYDIYPNKFTNKTNGITFRRWLMHSNPALSNFITKLIGNEWKNDANHLKELLQYIDDETVLKQLSIIKQEAKNELCKTILKNEGIELNPNSIFSIQIKRLHEYKRQQMNALYVIYKYLQIKNGILPTHPITMIFGAKAAPAYVMAKNIIHLLLCLQELINSDPDVAPYLKVVMVENYNVTYAEKLIPAADISEQISLASKEASGTGNMKFMLNGAVTIGTLDGANVEISNLVGKENIYLFGETSDQIISHYDKADYVSKDFYNQDKCIHDVLDFIISDELISIGDKKCLTDLYNELLNKDWFMTLLDFKDYTQVKDAMILDFDNSLLWNKKMLVNIAYAGYFSSDRTINDYEKDIWKLKK